MANIPVNLGSDSSQPASYYAAIFRAKWGDAAAQAYLAFDSQHPQDDPLTNAKAFALRVALEGVDKAVAAEAGLIGNVVTKGLPAVAKAAAASNPLSGLAAIGDFFGRLTEANTWIRVAEFILGAGLIIVGLAKLASGTAAGRAAMKVGKAAAIL